MSWQKLENENLVLAKTGRRRLNGRIPHLATTQANVTPIVGAGRQFVFMEPTSPKGKDLVQDGRSPNSAIISTKSEV